MSTKTKKELVSSQLKRTFEEPKLKFLKPKLTKQGDATIITNGGFIGTNGGINGVVSTKKLD
jgi:hypothetical protein